MFYIYCYTGVCIMKINYINWNITYINVDCKKCGKEFNIIPITGQMEKLQSEQGDADLDGKCPYCGTENKGNIDLENYSNAL